MPLVKKQSGWFWGSKGPFATKAKALAVARAAYASGYKSESSTPQLPATMRLEEQSRTNSGKNEHT